MLGSSGGSLINADVFQTGTGLAGFEYILTVSMDEKISKCKNEKHQMSNKATQISFSRVGQVGIKANKLKNSKIGTKLKTVLKFEVVPMYTKHPSNIVKL